MRNPRRTLPAPRCSQAAPRSTRGFLSARCPHREEPLALSELLPVSSFQPLSSTLLLPTPTDDPDTRRSSSTARSIPSPACLSWLPHSAAPVPTRSPASALTAPLQLRLLSFWAVIE